MRGFPDHEIFHFEWPVDPFGYEVEERSGDGATLAHGYKYEVIRPRGGPPQYYRPLADHPALWRQFAETCVTMDGVLSFSHQFGLIAVRECMLADVLRTAEHLRALMNLMDAEFWTEAASVFNRDPRPRLTATMKRSNQRGRFELVMAPLDLGGALLLQAGEAITGNQQFRRCRNCSAWMRIGVGGYTSRREYCSDRCRVAWGRRPKGDKQ